jgi:hypothetical protein
MLRDITALAPATASPTAVVRCQPRAWVVFYRLYQPMRRRRYGRMVCLELPLLLQEFSRLRHHVTRAFEMAPILAPSKRLTLRLGNCAKLRPRLLFRLALRRR